MKLLLLPARGEKVGMRGPLRWAENRRDISNAISFLRIAQNRGEAPSPSSLRSSTSPRTRGEVQHKFVLATPVRPSFAKATLKKNFRA